MNDTWKNILLMKMQIAWFCLFSFNALFTASLAALAGTQLKDADTQTRWMIAIGILASWTNAIMALFSKAMARVKDNDDPFIDDEVTSAIEKKTVTTASIKTTETVTPSPSDESKST